MSGPGPVAFLAFFASVDSACTETDNPAIFGEGDLGEGEEVGDGDGDGDGD